MKQLVAAEFQKILGRRMTWILLILLQLVGPVTILLFKLISQVQLDDVGLTEALGSLIGFPNGYLAVLALNVEFGSLLVIVFAAFFVGSEFGWGTISQLFARGPQRHEVIMAKLLALIGSVVAAVTLTMLISGVVMWVADLAFGTIAVAPPNNFGLDLLDRYLGTIGLLLFYGTVAFAVAILTRSAAAGMAIPLVFGFFTPFITEIASAVGDGFWDELPNYLPHRLEPTAYGQETLMAVFSGLSAEGDFSVQYEGPTRAESIGLLSLYALVLLGLGFLATARRDFPQSG